MRGSEFAEMSAFVAIAERRSFAKAAAHLGVTTSTLSHGIRKLEERLGVRLLNRTTRSVAPTEVGERLLARLRPALAGLAGAVESLNDFRDKPAGQLRLTVPPPAAGAIVAPMLARFLAAYPAIELEVSVDGTMVDVVRNRFDAGIRLGGLVERDMITLRIGQPVKVVVVAAPSYLARRAPPRAPSDLAAHDCIRMRLPNGGTLPWRFQGKRGRFEQAVRGPLVVNDRELELRAALDGVGLAYLPSFRVADALADGRLVSVLDDWTPPVTSFQLYYPSRRQIPAPLRALLDFVRAEAPGAAAKAPARRTRRPARR